jgi:hypothetical protein
MTPKPDMSLSRYDFMANFFLLMFPLAYFLFHKVLVDFKSSFIAQVGTDYISYFLYKVQ